MSFSVSTANVWATALAFTFPALLAALQPQGAFCLYAGLNVVAVTLVFLFMPETKQRTLEELDDVFSLSTRTFIRYQVGEVLPWAYRRYLKREKHATIRSMEDWSGGGRYQEVSSGGDGAGGVEDVDRAGS